MAVQPLAGALAQRPIEVAIADGLLFRAWPDGPRGVQRALKWGLDRVIALTLLIVLAPLMLLIALAIKLDSPGSVLIRQERLGRYRRPFHLYKFRSMVANAEALRGELEAANEVAAPLFKIRSDPRVTQVGRILRRLSLDELPQLINVLKGQMSLVGPRPPFAEEVQQDFLHQALRLRFLPGITGLWQVSGRSDLSYDLMIRLDLIYTRRWSIWLDVNILLRTIPIVLAGKGAC